MLIRTIALETVSTNGLKQLILRIRKKGLARYVRRGTRVTGGSWEGNEIKLIFGSAKRDMPTRLRGSSSLSVLMELRVAELPAIKAWSIPFRREGMGGRGWTARRN